MIYTTLYGDKKIASLSIEARFLFTGLVVFADDDGRLEGDPVLIKSKIYPRDENIKTEDIKKWLSEITSAGLIENYEVNSEPYISHPNWSKFQKLRSDRRKESNIPPPDNQMTTSCQPNDGHLPAEDKVSKGKISKGKIREDRANLPDWLDKEVWEKWVKYRIEIKHPMKPTTMDLQIKKLSKYQSVHKEVLLQSMEKGWQGIFPENYRPNKNNLIIKPAEDKYSGL